jgi:Fe-S cluster biogenesis protein NfuA
MLDKAEVSRVLDDIRPALQSHGGDVKLVDVEEDGIVKVELQGACHGCPMAQMTIKRGVEARLKKELPEVKEVVPVEPEEAEAE